MTFQAALAVDCPVCAAKASQPCLNRETGQAMPTQVHIERDKVAKGLKY